MSERTDVAGSASAFCYAGPWRCFFCDELIHDREEAAEHFGPRDIGKPACTYDVAEMRKMERELAMYHEEDTELHREITHLRSEIETEKRRAEEDGYARGLRDARRHPETLGLRTA